MSKKHKKKYPIHDGYFERDVLGKTCCCYNDLLDAVEQKLRETILGRISFIIRTLNPGSQSLDVEDKDFDIDGYPLKSISRKNDAIMFDIANGDSAEETLSGIAFDLDDIAHVCYQLEQEYVASGSRFISEDPYGDDYEDMENTENEPEELNDQQVFFANEIAGFLEDLREAFDHGINQSDIASIILSEASALIAMSDKPEEALDLFVKNTKNLNETVTKEMQSTKTSGFLS